MGLIVQQEDEIMKLRRRKSEEVEHYLRSFLTLEILFIET